jgi:carboxyl-terminal processing protease
MTLKSKLVLLSAIVIVTVGFKQADDYFEISKNLELFGAVYKTVNSEYVDEVNPGDLMKKGIDAMLASLDPYTNYYNESQAEEAILRQKGEYGGIGCRSQRIDNFTCITEVFKGMPADKSGMRVGDKIIEVNGKKFAGLPDEDLGDQLKGAPGSKVNIVVDRQGKTIAFDVIREEIKINNVSYFGMINAQTGYIKLDQFMIGSAGEIKQALIQLKTKGAQNIVLDLRDNGGGLLHEAVNIVNLFVPMDELVVVSKGRSKDAFKEYKTIDSPVDTKIPLIVLVNERSASASEIVCGSIQDLDRGIVVGRNTFGKGLVQNVLPLAYRNQMKITIAKYYIPSGRCIQLLDYGKKDKNGKATTIPDSLRKAFKTKNGRTVYDGGGVRPDFTVKTETNPSILNQLIKGHLIYQFANQYRNKHEQIGAVQDFSINTAEYEQFKDLVKENMQALKGNSDGQLEQFQKSLNEEAYSTQTEAAIKLLNKDLQTIKLNELEVHKNKIIAAINLEIAKRYYYDEANFLTDFKYDADILKSLELFGQYQQMETLLKGNK